MDLSGILKNSQSYLSFTYVNNILGRSFLHASCGDVHFRFKIDLEYGKKNSLVTLAIN